MRKVLFLTGLMLATGAPALARQAATHPELVGVASACEGVKAELSNSNIQDVARPADQLGRITVAPGQFIPMYTHSGPEFHYVIAGVLEETADGADGLIVAGSLHAGRRKAHTDWPPVALARH
jgi:hypothetical protein